VDISGSAGHEERAFGGDAALVVAVPGACGGAFCGGQVPAGGDCRRVAEVLDQAAGALHRFGRTAQDAGDGCVCGGDATPGAVVRRPGVTGGDIEEGLGVDMCAGTCRRALRGREHGG
jgi:hypothetical protein